MMIDAEQAKALLMELVTKKLTKEHKQQKTTLAEFYSLQQQHQFHVMLSSML
jgi:hypothetical protein